MKKKLKKYEGILYIAPWLIGALIFKVYPFITSFILSFTNYDLISSPSFIGLDNYINLFNDTQFLQSLGATFRYTIITVPMQLILALFVAFILNFDLKGIRLYQTAYYIPSILGGNVAVAILWRFLFSTSGLVNQVLNLVGLESVRWLSTPGPAMFVVALLRVWGFGSAMILFLAALKDIPEELYEAAEIDGASNATKFLKITLPVITPTIFFNIIMQTVNAMQEFNSPFLITGGGPLNATYLTPLMIYDNAFKFFRMGYASAMSWILFIILLVFTLILFSTQKYWVFYADEGR